MTYRLAWLPAASLLAMLAACGGKVVVDTPDDGSGGTTGTSTTTTSWTWTASGTTTTTTWWTTTTTTWSTATWTTSCGGSVVSPDPSCQSCAETNCCDALSQCAPGTPCGSLLACRNQCKDDACIQSCNQKFPGGQGGLANLDSCSQNGCQNECMAPICNSGASTPLLSCSNCLGANCCSEITACIQDSTCIDCLSNNPNAPQCQQSGIVQKTLSCLQSICVLSCQ